VKEKGYKKSIGFRLLVITDSRIEKNRPLPEIINKCCKYGVKAIQLREKEFTSKDLLALSLSLRKIAKKYSSALFINDRVDIALLSEADGVHSPENGIRASDVRKINSNFVTGKSVHSLGSAKEAEDNGYDYIIFGPVFRTDSKVKFGKPQGLKKLREINESVDIPVFAVGGITPVRAEKCIEAGASGVAVIGAIFRSTDLKKTIAEFRTSLGSL
jgi:thiamine-phosphate pyrophosphorylase